MSRSHRHGTRQLEKLPFGNWRWALQEPKAWRKIYKHRKRRAEWRRCATKLRQGYDPEGMVYPLDSRPWIYYW